MESLDVSCWPEEAIEQIVDLLVIWNTFIFMWCQYNDIVPHWSIYATVTSFLNTLSLRQNGCHFPDDIFKCIFLNETSCAHKWGQYTPALISTHPIKKYPTNSPIFKSLWSKIDRGPETYPISINPRDEMNRADSFREKLRKPRFSVNFWPPEGQKWGHEHENR